MPQFANGDGWRTSVILVNLSSVRLPFVLDFWRTDGSPWLITLVDLGPGDRLTGELPPGATVTVESDGRGALAQGWAELTYDYKAGSLGGFCVFRQTVPGRPDFEAVVPLSSLFESQVVLPYDNGIGFSTGVTLVNGAAQTPAAIAVTLRDENGAAYATDTINLPAGGQLAFSLPTRYTATQGRRGSVLFRSNTDFLSVLGLRFNPGGAFTSFHGLSAVEQ